MAVTPASRLFCALALGLVTTDQLRPFQCSMRVCATPVEVSDLPTAHTLVAETAAIPEMLAPETAGLLATVHLRPFQCSNWAVFPRRDSKKPPPAHTSVLEMAATPEKVPVTTAGVATTAHAVPFQCSASGWSLPREFSADPTAHTSLAVMLATAFSWLLPGEAFGLVTRLQGAVCASAAGASSTSAASAAAAAVSRRAFESLMLIPHFSPASGGERAFLRCLPGPAGIRRLLGQAGWHACWRCHWGPGLARPDPAGQSRRAADSSQAGGWAATAARDRADRWRRLRPVRLGAGLPLHRSPCRTGPVQ